MPRKLSIMNTYLSRTFLHLAAIRRIRKTQAAALFLTVVSTSCILFLTELTAAGTESSANTEIQALLVLSFIALSIVDFRASVAIAVFELVLAGAGGHWTSLPGNVSGRNFLDAVVAIRALTIIASDWRRTRHLELGRYGLHALTLAVVIPIVWMSLGLYYGNVRSAVFADGNGFGFFAFIVVIVALLIRRQGSWFRNLFFAACAVNGVVYLALVTVTATKWVILDPTMNNALLIRLDMGGQVGYMGNGAFRLFTGSSLFLQIGLALVAWRLITRPRQIWPWLLYAILSIDLLATYTRGLWVSGAAAVIMVIALGSPTLKRAALVVTATAVMWGLIAAGGALNGFSLREYVFNRSATIVSVGPSTPTSSTPTSSSSSTNSSKDAWGEASNKMRIEQAKILFRLIKKRPVLGYGFGAVAKEWGPSYAFELSYIALLFKAGIIGLLLYLSFPLRLLWDSWRVRFSKRSPPQGISLRAASIPFAIVASIMLAGSTNPYLFAAFGIISILAATAWLDDTKPTATPAET
jgi:hypothetical protein